MERLKMTRIFFMYVLVQKAVYSVVEPENRVFLWSDENDEIKLKKKLKEVEQRKEVEIKSRNVDSVAAQQQSLNWLVK